MAFWYYLVYNNNPTPRRGLSCTVVFLDVNAFFFEMRRNRNSFFFRIGWMLHKKTLRPMLRSMTGMTCPILNYKRTLQPRATVFRYPMATWTATNTLGPVEPSTKVRWNTWLPWYDIQHNNYGILVGGIPEFLNRLHAYNLVYATCPDVAKGPWVWSCSSLASGSVSISSSKSPWWIPEAGQRQTKHLSMHTSETIRRIQHFYKYLFPMWCTLDIPRKMLPNNQLASVRCCEGTWFWYMPCILGFSADEATWHHWVLGAGFFSGFPIDFTNPVWKALPYSKPDCDSMHRFKILASSNLTW